MKGNIMSKTRVPKITSKIDRITLIPDEYRKLICPAPKAVKIELTSRCDLQCFFCATRLKLRGKGDMDFDFYKRITVEMRESAVEELGLFYLGESFLYKLLPDAIDHAARVCHFPYIFLTTNGVLATKERVEECMTAGLDSLKFSINSADAVQFKSVTGVNAFDKVMTNIADAWLVREKIRKRTGHTCGLYASSIVYDEAHKEKMKPLIDEISGYIDEFYFLPMYNQGGYTKGNVAGNVGRLDNMRESLPCWALFTEGHITFDGMLTGCCFSHEPHWDFGDLNTMTFMDAWNSEAAQKLRQANLNKDVTGTACEKCIVYK